MFRAERLYEDTLGPDKNRISNVMTEFDNAMNTKTRLEMEIVRRKLENLLDEIEQRDYQGLIS